MPRAETITSVVDLKLDGESGLELIPLLIEINPDMNIVVLTSYSSITTARSLGMYRRTLQRKTKKPAAE